MRTNPPCPQCKLELTKLINDIGIVMYICETPKCKYIEIVQEDN